MPPLTNVVVESTTTLEAGNAWEPYSTLLRMSDGRPWVEVGYEGFTRYFRLRILSQPLTLPAPQVDATVVTDVGSSSVFLYTGTDPVQTGVTNGTILAVRAAVLKGIVQQSGGQPLSGVKITIMGHAEFGQTLTRADGRFDMALNGGGALVVRYEKAGFLPAQRTVSTVWQDFREAPLVVLMPADAVVTTVELGVAAVAPQVARGSVQGDKDGQRQATLIIPAATSASLVMPDGTKKPVTSINIRATEFTVGEQGGRAMPAALPPTSAYTYCVELSADEAITAGAATVQFDQPLHFYVENFLGMPVGIPVPSAYYDSQKGQWIPVEDGRVIKILAIDGGRADIDVTGTGNAADGPTLGSLGVTDAEREKLAGLYAVGTSLWRVRMTHFTSYDLNYGVVPEKGAATPRNPPPRSDQIADSLNSNSQPGYGRLELENQVFHESQALVGTPYTLHYASDRVPGRMAGNTLVIPLSDTNVPSVMKRIQWEVAVAGKVFSNSVAPGTNLTYTFQWDGKDAYGRTVNGAQPVQIKVGYVYNGYYALPPSIARSFGAVSGERIPGNVPSRQDVVQWQEQRALMGHWLADGMALGGWTLSIHHAYDPNSRIIYYGDGRQRSANNMNYTITTVAGTGSAGYNGDGLAATSAKLNYPPGMCFAPDGSMLIADGSNARIRRVDPNGIITTVAGGGGSTAENIPATQAALSLPIGVFSGPDGSFYVVDKVGRIRRVSSRGVITTLAGTGVKGYSGDGGPAIQARLNSPQQGIAAPDGTIYIADWLNYVVRRITTDGIITTYAGTGVNGFSGDGGPASKAMLSGVPAIALGPDGSLYISSDRHIRKVTPDGLITTIAGNNTTLYSGDGGPAILAGMTSNGIDVAPNGNVYISDAGNRRIRCITPDGIMSTIAGNGAAIYAGDEGPATQGSLIQPDDVVVGPDGSIYFPDYNNHRVRKISKPMPGFGLGDVAVPSEDGDEIYQFNANGRHLKTWYALTGSIRHEFGYDAAGLLVKVTDGNGRITAIERDAAGRPVAVVAPFGQRTRLFLDGNGYLAACVNPAGHTNQYQHSPSGLLERITGATGAQYQVSYDEQGRAIRASDPEGGSTGLAREDAAGSRTIRVLSAEGRSSSYRVETLATGEQRQINAASDGLLSQSFSFVNGTISNRLADGTKMISILGADVRFGMLSPIVKTQIVRTPSGLSSTNITEQSANISVQGNPLSLTSLRTRKIFNNRVTTASYTNADNRLVTVSPEGRQQVALFDRQGRLVEKRVPGLEAFTQEFGTDGRLLSTRVGTGENARLTQFAYDSSGRLQYVTNAMGGVVEFIYDGAGRLVKQTLPNGRQVRHDYDPEGRIIAVTPPEGDTHRFSYTATGLDAQYTPPVAGNAAYSTLCHYNKDQQLIAQKMPGGVDVRYLYDGAGRFLGLQTDGVTNHYQYDADKGTLASISNSANLNLVMKYDGSLLVEESWSGVFTGKVARAYDNSFRVTSHIINGTITNSYLYDKDSFLVRAGERVLARNPQNGLLMSATLGRISENWVYNGFGEVSNYVASVNGSMLAAFTYEYDRLGRIATKTETLRGKTTVWSYRYDLVSRLVAAERDGIPAVAYAYDANGNRTMVAQNGIEVQSVYNGRDQLISAGQHSYFYSPDGYLTNKVMHGESTQYTYDALGNLHQIIAPDGERVDYLLDGINRRLVRRVNGQTSSAYLYQDARRVIAKVREDGKVEAVFVHGTGASAPDYMRKGGVNYGFIRDAVGSVRLVVNTQTGDIVQQLDYNEYGVVMLDTNPGFQPFAFAGGLLDGKTGLVHFGAREYDPESGRWTALDPLRFAGGTLNLYSYALNSPINVIDPTGLGPNMTSDQYRDLLNPYAASKQADELLKEPIGNALKKPIYSMAQIQQNQDELARVEAEMFELTKCTSGGTSRQPVYTPGKMDEGNPIVTTTDKNLDISDPTVRMQIEQGAGGGTSLMELYDTAYKLRRLQVERMIYLDFLSEARDAWARYDRIKQATGL